jgi:hypothetical protein
MGRNAIPPLDIPPSLPYNHSMDVFEEQLRQKFARFEKLLADTGKIRLAIQENENKLLSIVDALRRLVSMDQVEAENSALRRQWGDLQTSDQEPGQSDVPPASTYTQAEAPMQRVKLHPPRFAKSPALTPAQNSEVESMIDAEMAKTQVGFVLDLLRRNLTRGQTPAEIKKTAASFSRQFGPNFPYGDLNKLKARNKIREDNGRYFLTQGS